MNLQTKISNIVAFFEADELVQQICAGEGGLRTDFLKALYLAAPVEGYEAEFVFDMQDMIRNLVQLGRGKFEIIQAVKVQLGDIELAPPIAASLMDMPVPHPPDWETPSEMNSGLMEGDESASA